MKKQKTKRCSGESIVEVMAGAVVFLLLMAILTRAVMFGNKAQEKSRQIRRQTSELCKNLRTTSEVDDGTVPHEFYAVSTDGTVTGNQVFTITAPKKKKDVPYTKADGSTQTVTFYLYGTD